MLREDGVYEFYQVQEYQSAWNRWMNIADNYYLKEYEFGEMSASGQCWQETGCHGTYDLEYAKEYCNTLNELAEKEGPLNDAAKVTKFRIIKVNISQSKTIMEFNRY